MPSPPLLNLWKTRSCIVELTSNGPYMVRPWPTRPERTTGVDKGWGRGGEDVPKSPLKMYRNVPYLFPNFML